MYSDHISYQAMRQPHAIAVSLPEKEVTYGTFEAHINTVAHHLRPLLEPGSRVAIVIDKIYVHWLVMLALARLGHVSTSVPVRDRDDRAALVSPDAVLTQDRSWSPAGIATHVLSDRWIGEALAAPDPGRVPVRPRPQDPARIMTSSGTTGTRKLLLFTHDAIIRRVERGIFGSIGRYDSRVIVSMGIGTFGGFGVPLRSWLFGGALCLLPPSPQHLLERHVTGLITSPAGLKQILDRWPADFPRIPNLTITVGGSRLSKELSTAVRLRMTPDIIMGYGSSEVSGVAMAPASLLDIDPAATGIVLPWIDLEVVDAQDRPVPAGQAGQIRIRTDIGVDRYLGDPEMTARVFRDGWFYSGDIGSVSGGILRIAGRADDVMNLGGRKVLPEAVEPKLAQCRGVEDVAVFSIRGDGGVEEPWCAIVAGDDLDRPQFDAIVGRTLGPKVKLLVLKQIPRNEMGKVERAQLRAVARKAVLSA